MVNYKYGGIVIGIVRNLKMREVDNEEEKVLIN